MRYLRRTRPLLLAIFSFALMAALAPAGASAFQKAVWGPVTYRGINQFPLYQRMGVKIYETSLNWSVVASRKPTDPTSPSDPAYRWPGSLSNTINQAASHGLRVLLAVSNAPVWANGGHHGDGWAPKSARTYAQFLQAAAREYPTVHLWMVWNEPNRAGTFRPETPVAYTQTTLTAAQARAPRLYALMLNDAYGALKSVSSANLVIGGDTYTSGLIDPQQWLSNMKLPGGRVPRMSMYGQDPFGYTVPLFNQQPSPYGEVQFSDLPQLESWTGAYLGHRVPLFLSQYCVPTAPDHTFNFYVSPPSVASAWVKDALVTARHAGYIYALGWAQVHDQLPLNSCGLINANGTRKPDFYAFVHN
ncbi:MAG: hypothetical protein ACP5H2_11765 [Solirubrobacteraceae bacterium]